MSQLFEAMNGTATTDNGCKAFHTSLDVNLDFFYLSGASRGKCISTHFRSALAANRDLAIRNLLWLRDIREGAGERQLFRELFLVAVNEGLTSEEYRGIFEKIIELGRLDDLLVIGEELRATDKNNISRIALSYFAKELSDANKLAFKWCPVKGETAKVLRKFLGFKTEKDWRRYIVSNRKTVEQNMCAKEWDTIDFGKVPSVASARYQKAFLRNAKEKYEEYKTSLVKGENKINAGAVHPHHIYMSCINGDRVVAEQQWKALPNYLEGSQERILPLIDVSSSMSQREISRGLTPMHIAISLGWYLSERQVGVLKNIFMTFESEPRMLKIGEKETLSNTFEIIRSSPWGGSTNIQKAFAVLLKVAVDNKIPQSEMPTQICILSDMQFNSGSVQGASQSAFETVNQLYREAGYELPRIVFWNLNGANTTKPVTKGTFNTAMVSGFSPSIMKGILKGGLTPEQTMMDTLMIPRYDISV